MNNSSNLNPEKSSKIIMEHPKNSSPVCFSDDEELQAKYKLAGQQKSNRKPSKKD
jgi:hypothetical protein